MEKMNSYLENEFYNDYTVLIDVVENICVMESALQLKVPVTQTVLQTETYMGDDGLMREKYSSSIVIERETYVSFRKLINEIREEYMKYYGRLRKMFYFINMGELKIESLLQAETFFMTFIDERMKLYENIEKFYRDNLESYRESFCWYNVHEKPNWEEKYKDHIKKYSVERWKGALQELRYIVDELVRKYPEDVNAP